jgi:filamentous hemagglutinin
MNDLRFGKITTDEAYKRLGINSKGQKLAPSPTPGAQQPTYGTADEANAALLQAKGGLYTGQSSGPTDPTDTNTTDTATDFENLIGGFSSAGMFAQWAMQSGTGTKIAVGAKGGTAISATVIEPKIVQQMGVRGWTAESIDATIANPAKTVVTKDTRFDPISGTRLNDPATGYVAKDGSYVVRNDRTGQVVQVSNKMDPTWKAPWDK